MPKIHDANSIAETIRSEIVSGQFPSGTLIPRQIELEKRFRVSRMTIVKALRRLSRDGFIVSNKRAGTIVHPEPPHVGHYGLVFPCRPEEGVWSSYWKILSELATAMPKKRQPRITQYYHQHGESNHPDYIRLTDDVRNHRMAGLIFATMPIALMGKPPMTESHMPRAGVMAVDSFPGDTKAVWFDYDSLLNRTVEFLHQKKVSRLALICACEGALSLDDQKKFVELCRRQNIDCPISLQHAVSISHPAWGRNLLRLLMELPTAKRPEAIFLADDTIARECVDALSSLPGPLPLILAHANFPSPLPAKIPVTRIGFDIRDVFNRLMSLIDAQRNGEKSIPALSLVPAVFESELTSLS